MSQACAGAENAKMNKADPQGAQSCGGAVVMGRWGREGTY